MIETIPAAVPHAVNEAGDVVGMVRLLQTDSRPFRKPLGQPLVELPTDGRPGVAEAGTDWGAAVGTLHNQPGQPFDSDAVGWLGTARVEVFPGSPHSSRAIDVINAGWLLASETRASPAGATHHPLLRLPNGTVIELDPEHTNSDALDMNEFGIVVGYINGGGDFDGVLWIYGGEIPLHSLLDATPAIREQLQTPAALNDHAWVVGTRSGLSGPDKSWLLRPPPAASSG